MSESLSRRLERLVALSTELATEAQLEAVLQRIATGAATLVGARYAALGLLAPDGKSLESFTTHGIPPEKVAQMGSPPTGKGVLGIVIRDGNVVRLKRLGSHPESVGFPLHHPAMQSFLGVPVVGRHGIIGDLYLTEKVGREEFSQEDENITVLLAARAAAAVENARQHQESARLLTEVYQLQRTRERFFAMVNHELRNAMAAVYGWAEMLVRRKDPQTVPRAAFEVLEAAESAKSLISDLLDLSRLDEDRLKPVLREEDCCAVVKRTLSKAYPEARSRNVQLISNLPAGGLVTRTDAHRVEQILVNLLSNAIRHTPNGSTVTVTLRGDQGHTLCVVEDQGLGVAPDDIESIFDVYVTNAGEERHGIGLGLPLARRLARLLGGDLKATARPGQGGCFSLELPAPTSQSA